MTPSNPINPIASELPLRRTRVKICGLTTLTDVHAAVQAGADAVGFVFYPPSVRAIAIPSAQLLRAQIPAFVSVVALFVNPTVDEVRAVLQAVSPDLLQFHGAETAAFCAQFGRPYIKAVAVDAHTDLLDYAARYRDASALLVDTPSPGHGGSGKVFDWSVLPKSGIAARLVLSGGLNAGNVREAIASVRPFAVDVSSGVESAKGVKSPVLIEQFVRSVVNADVAHQN